MDIADWRKKIDELDKKLVELINQRAGYAREIGRLKRNTDLPIYEPDREKKIYENVQRANQGPLPDRELNRIYERLIDVMRKFQKADQEAEARSAEVSGGDTELEADVND